MQEILVAVIAGLLAGMGTGFAGLSAAVFISPMLISFLGVDSFSAIGIALASDVLASGVSTITYRRHGNIDLHRNWPLMASVLVVTVIGSVASHAFTRLDTGEAIMGWWLVISVLG
ncbi:MAG: sulfite exporter TauE/SafE family protein, partial [Atopobiaceae bacterium]|nr:sulfite exporter TauE/SafE family protein [Atopobiaceae bacterium]